MPRSNKIRFQKAIQTIGELYKAPEGTNITISITYNDDFKATKKAAPKRTWLDPHDDEFDLDNRDHVLGHMRAEPWKYDESTLAHTEEEWGVTIPRKKKP